MKMYYDETLAESIERSVGEKVVNIKENFKKITTKKEEKIKELKKFELIGGMVIFTIASVALSRKFDNNISAAKPISEEPVAVETQAVEFDIPGNVPIQTIEDLPMLGENNEVQVNNAPETPVVNNDVVIEDIIQTQAPSMEESSIQPQTPAVEEKTVQIETPVVSEQPTTVADNNVVPVVDGNVEKADEVVASRKKYESANEDVIAKAKEIIAMDTPSGSIVLNEFLINHSTADNEALLGTLLYIDPVAINNNITNENEYLNVRGVAYNIPQEEQGRGR